MELGHGVDKKLLIKRGVIEMACAVHCKKVSTLINGKHVWNESWKRFCYYGGSDGLVTLGMHRFDKQTLV